MRQDGNTLLTPAIGYDLGRSRDDGLYRQVLAALMLEARSRNLVLNLSAGVGRFKLHRGARPTLEYDAVMTSGLPFRQRLAWWLVEVQGKVWSRKLVRQPGSGCGAGTETERWQRSAGHYHDRGRQRLWRQCSDAIYQRLLERMLVPGRSQCALKTDLWDEVYGGGLMPFLQTRAREVYGIDIAEGTVHLAQQSSNGLKAVVGDVRKLPFPDGIFDLVVSNSTLDHFMQKQDLRKAIGELARVLEPGGQLLISLDNPANPIIRLRMLLPVNWLQRLGLIPYYVGATLGAAELCRVLEANGLRVERLEPAVHCPRVLMVALAALMQRWAPRTWQARFVDFQHRFEPMGRWPTRFLTGHYSVVRAIKR